MAGKSQYMTKHRSQMLAYFAQHGSGHFTVADLCAYFKEQGIGIGTTTVYRQLEHMVDEGIVNKYIIDANSPACFEYIGREEHCHEDVCFHCKCESCGKLIHLHCTELMGIREHLREHHNFLLTPTRTVFYGLCEDCAGDALTKSDALAGDGSHAHDHAHDCAHAHESAGE